MDDKKMREAQKSLSDVKKDLAKSRKAATTPEDKKHLKQAEQSLVKLAKSLEALVKAKSPADAKKLGKQVEKEQKTAAQIHQIHMDTKAKVSEMYRETYVNRRKSADKMHEKIKQLMMS